MAEMLVGGRAAGLWGALAAPACQGGLQPASLNGRAQPRPGAILGDLCGVDHPGFVAFAAAVALMIPMMVPNRIHTAPVCETCLTPRSARLPSARTGSAAVAVTGSWHRWWSRSAERRAAPCASTVAACRSRRHRAKDDRRLALERAKRARRRLGASCRRRARGHPFSRSPRIAMIGA
jgi:hypothetical protein